MADANKVLEGSLKYRDGKKWKPRWCVLQRLSPVADCLHLFMYKEYLECYKTSSKSSIPLEDFYGLQHRFSLDKENHVLALVCRNRIVVLAFHNQETLECWKLTILQHLGEGKLFVGSHLKMPSSEKPLKGPVNVYVHHSCICLVMAASDGLPPQYLAAFKVRDLQRFGILADRFCFVMEQHNDLIMYSLIMPQMTEFDNLLKNIAQGKNTESPPLPPKLCKSSAMEGLAKPRLSSPMYKSMSLDRHSIHKSENSRSEMDCGNNDTSSFSGMRRQMSEPHEFAVATGKRMTTSNSKKTQCYENVWNGAEPSEKVILLADRRLSCNGYCEISAQPAALPNHSSQLSKSLSKICKPSYCCCAAESENGPLICKTVTSAYINISKDDDRLVKENLVAAEVPVKCVRNVISGASCIAYHSGTSGDSCFIRKDSHEERVNGFPQEFTCSIPPRADRAVARRRTLDDPPSARDPLKPLQFVDLGAFDGDESEGYLHSVKGCQPGEKVKESTANASEETAKDNNSSMYTNMSLLQTARSLDRKPVEGMRASELNARPKSSIHASLKRPTKVSVSPKDLPSSTPPAPNSGSYAELRLDLALPPSMLRSSSYYNIQLNTVVPLPPRRPDGKEKPSTAQEKPVITPRTIPPTPSAPALAARKGSLQETIPCRHSFSIKSDNLENANTDYIPMYGPSQLEDNAIFFPVNLPLKREDSRTTDQRVSHIDSNSADACLSQSFSGVPLPPACNDDSLGYIDMTVKGSNTSDCLSDSGGEQLHPRLMHSRSLENELDSSPEAEELRCQKTRRTSHGIMQTDQWWNLVLPPAAPDDYVPMAVPTDDAKTRNNSLRSQVSAKPFDNLISHGLYKNSAHHDESRGTFLGNTDRANLRKRDIETFVSDSAINFSSQRSGSIKSGKTGGLLARFFNRRLSVKEKVPIPNSRIFPGSSLRSSKSKHSQSNTKMATSLDVSYDEPPVIISDSSSSSSLEKLGPPPPVPVVSEYSSSSDRGNHEDYINLSSVSSGLPATECPIPSDSNALPPPLPPKALSACKSFDANSSFRHSILLASGEKNWTVDKPPLRKIAEDEQEVPPLPEKARCRSACHSKSSIPDSPTVVKISPDTSPKPPVPPRSVASAVVNSPASHIASQRSPRMPLFQLERESGQTAVKSRKPNLTVNINPTPERRSSSNDAVTLMSKATNQVRHLSDLRMSVWSRLGSEMSSASVSSEEGRPSPALTTMRPRYGKEYQCIDRRRLFEEGSPFTPQRSPSMASSVFTFDIQNVVSRGGVSGNCSSGENSPKYPPSIRSRLANDHTPSSHNVSPIVLDPIPDVLRSPDRSVLLNYAEIDLSSTEPVACGPVQRTSSRSDQDRTEYALIDMIATSAASRVGKEHARQREDILERKERKAEVLSAETKDSRLGSARGMAPFLERKGSMEPKRTPSVMSRDQK